MIGRALGAALAAVTASVGAAACCAPPLLVAALGLSSAGLGGALQPYRSLFLGLSAAFFGAGLWIVRRGSDPRCDDEGCERCRAARWSRRVLWTALVAAVAIAFYPTWSGWL